MSRAAGSHGEFDLWATNGKLLLLVQCKRGYTEEKADALLLELIDYLRQNIKQVGIPILLSVAFDFSQGKVVSRSKLLLPSRGIDEESIGEESKAVETGNPGTSE